MITLSSLNGRESIDLPNPHMSNFSQLQATFVNQGRNTLGEIIAQKVGRDQAKLTMTWSYLPQDEWEKMLAFWNENFFFNCTYYDSAKRERITRKFYVGDRTARPLNTDSNGVPTFGYVDCSANVIDCGEGV